MRNNASLVSPCSLRQVPPRSARVAGRQPLVAARSMPVVFFMALVLRLAKARSQAGLRVRWAKRHNPAWLRPLAMPKRTGHGRRATTRSDRHRRPAGAPARSAGVGRRVDRVLRGAGGAGRLAIPSIPFFDEVHYLPAARELLGFFETGQGAYLNREHPLLGKELIALGIGLFGDTPLGWRIMPLAFGTLALFASMRALWHASGDRFATLAFGVLLASGFHLFIQSRIAMLDVFMVAFLAVAAWQICRGLCAARKGPPAAGADRRGAGLRYGGEMERDPPRHAAGAGVLRRTVIGGAAAPVHEPTGARRCRESHWSRLSCGSGSCRWRPTR